MSRFGYASLTTSISSGCASLARTTFIVVAAVLYRLRMRRISSTCEFHPQMRVCPVKSMSCNPWLSLIFLATNTDETVAVKSEMRINPLMIVIVPTILPANVIGTLSPYPTVEIVTMDHHSASPKRLKFPRVCCVFRQQHQQRCRRNGGNDDDESVAQAGSFSAVSRPERQPSTDSSSSVHGQCFCEVCRISGTVFHLDLNGVPSSRERIERNVEDRSFLRVVFRNDPFSVEKDVDFVVIDAGKIIPH